VKKTTIFALLALTVGLCLFVLSGCGDQATTRDIEPEISSQANEDHSGHDHPTGAPAASGGKILETMNSGGYSYVRLDMDGKEVWAAGPTSSGLAVGDFVYITGSMEMRNFHAKSLDRTFDTILFVGSISKDAPTADSGAGKPSGMGGMGGMGQADEPVSGTKTKLENAKVEGVTKAKGGHTVSEIYAQAATLAGQQVVLRGRVVKFSPNIMGTNWLHVQDGTGDDNTSDLTVTTSGHAQVGDLVLVKGPLTVDKDFGAGYKYHVIIEGATVTKE
jgi:hypothetical protein